MDDWDRGRWCDVCHQKHYQIHPPCFEERRRREREPQDFAALLKKLPLIPWERAREMGFPYNVPNGADEEHAEGCGPC